MKRLFFLLFCLFPCSYLLAQWKLEIHSITCEDKYRAWFDDQVYIVVADDWVTYTRYLGTGDIVYYDDDGTFPISTDDIDDEGEFYLALKEESMDPYIRDLGGVWLNVYESTGGTEYATFRTDDSEYTLKYTLESNAPNFPARGQIGYLCWERSFSSRYDQGKIMVLEVQGDNVRVEFIEDVWSKYYYEGDKIWVKKNQIHRFTCEMSE